MRKKIIALTAIALTFSACSKQVEYIKPAVPKLKKCIVKKKRVSYIKNGDKICLKEADFKTLKKQNYRLRVCNELLNKQNEDFNKNFAKGSTDAKSRE